MEGNWWSHHPLDVLRFLWSLEDRDTSHSRLDGGDHNILVCTSVLLELLWLYRKSITHGDPKSNPASFFEQLSKTYFGLVEILPKASPWLSLSWSHPPDGWIKVNFDVALGISIAAIACIARSSDGSIVQGISHKVHTSCPLVAECLTTYLAINLVCEVG